MASRSTYLKLGQFVVAAFSALVAIGTLIGISRLHHRVIYAYTFFDEPVTGLETGAPVRVRGVPIGQVGLITFGPDHRTVEVRSDIDVDALERLGFPSPEPKGIMHIPSSLRTQLASQGLTGGRFLAIDFFDEATNPPPPLPFQPPENYIPAARSVQHSLEEAAKTALMGVAELVETLRQQKTAERIAGTTQEANEVLVLLHQMLRDLDQQGIPQRAGATIAQLQQAVTRINRLIDRVDDEPGLLGTTQRSVGAVGEAGRSVTETTRNLNETLEEIRAAAASMRTLIEELERHPDMLLKGRGQERAP